jgi:energy-coupling factor transporter transmembrane protein EcfT
MIDWIRQRLASLTPRALGLLYVVAIGTTLGFLISLSRPLIKLGGALLKSYLLPLPPHTFTQALVVLLSLIAVGLLRKLPWKIWRSLKLGLIRFQDWVWGFSVVIFWLAYDSHRAALARGSIAFAVLASALADLFGRGSTKINQGMSGVLESDLPVPEGGEDLLGRQEMIGDLVSTILLEQPAIIAVTGTYGEGKTSFLNLAIGELRKLAGPDLPVIVRFNPWLAADSDALVLSLSLLSG